MHQPNHQWNFKARPRGRHEQHRAFSNIEAPFDGQTAEFGYNRVIFDLLKDPVSLGMRGESSNLGRRR